MNCATSDWTMKEDTRILALGIRGSRERVTDSTDGMGPAVHDVVRRVSAELIRGKDAVRLELQGVPYPASSTRYRRSRALGSSELLRLMDAAVTQDVDRSLVLVGLSQGADAIRHTLVALETGSKLIDQILAIVLLGDPNRYAELSETFQNGCESTLPGLLANAGIALRPELQEKTWSYCLCGDQVCANSKGRLGVFFSGTHTHYERNAEHVLDRSAAFVVGRIRAHSLS